MTSTMKQIIPNCCWQVDKLLTRDECQAIVNVGAANGIETKVAAGDVRHRNNCKHAMHDQALAETLWERLKSVVPKDYVITDDDESKNNLPAGFVRDTIKDGSCQGRWQPYGVNPHFSLLYYSSGGHFGPHRDSHVVLSEHERSLLTVSIYLVDRPVNHGGATNFLRHDLSCPPVDGQGRIRSAQDDVMVKVESNRAGKAVVFVHDLLHEGETLEVRREDGSVDTTVPAVPKWLLITQVLYRRDPESAPQLTDAQVEARQFLKQAEEAEVQGNVKEAIRLYNRAYRLDPSLE